MPLTEKARGISWGLATHVRKHYVDQRQTDRGQHNSAKHSTQLLVVDSDGISAGQLSSRFCEADEKQDENPKKFPCSWIDTQPKRP